MNYTRWDHLSHGFLRRVYQWAPFDIKGNWEDNKKKPVPNFLSCLIISSRKKELNNILEDLSLQTLPANRFEIIVVDDTSQESTHQIGLLRNKSLDLSKGEYLLLLDDDTRIFQKEFLKEALEIFQATNAQGILPKALPLYGIVKHKYDFLDSFSVTNRCCFLTRQLLREMGGFLSSINAYEDIELSLRLVMAGQTLIIKTPQLQYMHPPLYFEGMKKPLAIGQVIYGLKKIYSPPVWLLVYLNSLRFLFFALWPFGPNAQWLKISWGVFLYPFKPYNYIYGEGPEGNIRSGRTILETTPLCPEGKGNIISTK